MEIIKIGPWFLLAIGVATLILAILQSLKPGISKGKWFLWVFGFSLCGVAIWGPQFFSPYSSFIQTISDLYPNVSNKSTSDALMKIARGEMSPEYSDITAWYIIDHVPERIDSLLDNAINESTSSEGEEVLKNAKEILKRKRFSADLIRRMLQSSDEANILIDKIDPVMQSMVAAEIIKLPDSIRVSMKINDGKLFSLKEKKYQFLKSGF